MDFSSALKEVKNEKKIAREGWNGKGMYVLKVTPQITDYVDIKHTFSPYFVIKTPADEYEVWTPSTKDLFAEDWYVVE